MGNIREERRRGRLNNIKAMLKSIKISGEKINKEYIIAHIMDKYAVSRRVSREDIEAMMLIIDMGGFGE